MVNPRMNAGIEPLVMIASDGGMLNSNKNVQVGFRSNLGESQGMAGLMDKNVQKVYTL